MVSILSLLLYLQLVHYLIKSNFYPITIKMKPKNSKERRNSFLKFLLLFIVTVGFIVVTIFFTFQIPKKENSILKEEIKAVKKERLFQEDFQLEMNRVKSMIDSLDAPGQNFSYQNSLISDNLVDLQELIPTKDSEVNYELYKGIVNSLVDLQESKKRLKGLTDAENTIEDYKVALEKCKEDYKEVERDLDIARRRSN